VCALDPVVSGKDGRAAAAAGCGFTSELRLEVLRRWELTKLVAVLPDYALARAVNMDPALALTHKKTGSRTRHHGICGITYASQQLCTQATAPLW